MTKRGFSGTTALVLLLILAWAGWLRLSALDFGDGRARVRPDEDSVPFTFSVMDRGGFSPPLVFYGGGYFYPLWAFAHVFDAIAPQPDDAAQRRPGAREILAARWWSALLSWASVALVFVIARRLAGTGAGVVAALLLATCPLAVREAHFGKADSAAAFATTLFLWTATRRFAGDAARTVSIAAALAFGVSNKLSVGLLPAAAYALLFPPGEEGIPWHTPWRRLLLSGALAVGIFLLLNPHWVKEPTTSAAYLKSLVPSMSDKSWLPGREQVSEPIVYHVAISLRYGAGLLLSLLAAPALAYGLYRDRAARVVSLTSLGLWGVLLTSPRGLARFFLPVVPGLFVLTAVLLVAVLERLQRLRAPGEERSSLGRSRATAFTLAVVALIVVAEPARSSFRITSLLGQSDTRVLAGDWIAANVPDDARILCVGSPTLVLNDWGCPPLGQKQSFRDVPPSAWAARKISYVVFHNYPLGYSSVPLPVQLAGRQPVAVFEPFAPDAIDSPVLEPMDAFYLPLGRLKGFVRPGPRIEIYRVGDAQP